MISSRIQDVDNYTRFSCKKQEAETKFSIFFVSAAEKSDAGRVRKGRPPLLPGRQGAVSVPRDSSILRHVPAFGHRDITVLTPCPDRRSTAGRSRG